MQRLFLIAVFAFGPLALAGCSSESSEGVPLIGTVMFNGNPVPSGMIYFDPKGGGSQGSAQIEAGKYDTSKGGRPAPTGEVTVRIEGFSESTPPEPLFKYETKLTLTPGEPTKNFEVPASAGKNVSKRPVAPA